MSWRIRGSIALVLTLVAASPGAGTAASQETGRTIWDGVFTEAQAERGREGYLKSCASCHAEDLLGTSNAPPLVGQPFLGRFDRASVDEVIETVRRTMPQEAPGSLGAPVYVDIASYVFKANGSPAGAAELPVDRAALKQIMVTNR